MEQKFYREKNANSIYNARTLTPNTGELKRALLDKLRDKANHIRTIFIDDSRNQYIVNKGMQLQVKNLTEEQVKIVLATRLSADILQLIMDISEKFEIPIKIKKYEEVSFDETFLTPYIIDNCNLIEENSRMVEPNEALQEILNAFYCYINIYDLSFKQIDKERKHIEKEEGSFLKGKFVIYE